MPLTRHLCGLQHCIIYRPSLILQKKFTFNPPSLCLPHFFVQTKDTLNLYLEVWVVESWTEEGSCTPHSDRTAAAAAGGPFDGFAVERARQFWQEGWATQDPWSQSQ